MRLLLALVLCCVVRAQYACSFNAAAKQIDHVILGVQGSAANAKALFDLLSGPLGLPVAWQFQIYGTTGITFSGGISLGNLNVEISPAHAMGIQPCDSNLTRVQEVLSGRNVTSALSPIAGSGFFQFQSLLLLEFLNKSMPLSIGPFLTQYTFDQAESRQAFWKDLLAGSNPLGVLFADSISLSFYDTRFRDTVDSLFAKPNYLPLAARFEGGPVINATLNAGQNSAMRILEIRVRVVNAARTAAVLQKLGVLGASSENSRCFLLDNASLPALPSVSIKFCED